jgi:hypothetical protein
MTQDIIGITNKASKEWLKELPSPEETANPVPKRFLEIFAKLIAAKEREACARVCEAGVDTEHPTVKGHIMKDFGASTHLANAIRARGQGTPERGQA